MFLRSMYLDLPLVVSAILLSSLGVLVLFGLGIGEEEGFFYTIFVRQVIFFLVSFSFFLILANFDYRGLRSLGTRLYFFVLGALIILLFFGKVVHGTTGWISLGFLNIQPVEFAKIILIVFLASFISQKRSIMSESTQIIASFVLTGIMALLVLLQPDLGSAMVLFGIWLGMLLFSGVDKRYVAGIFIIGIVVTILSWFLLAQYQKDRILTFLSPEADIQGSGYNAYQSIVAVGSGGLMGHGIGRGTQSQLSFLPERHTDFIFATLAESLGFIGAFFVLVLFLVLFWRIRNIAMRAKDNFGYLVAIGVFCMILVQMVVNIGMNIGIVPITGIPLPFVSYGGSSLLATFMALALVMSIRQTTHKYSMHSM